MTSNTEHPEERTEQAPSQPAGGGNPASGPEEEATLAEQLAEMMAERDAHYDRFLRSQADLENYRKRVQKEFEDIRERQTVAMARDLLPVLDNLHRAVAAGDETAGAGDLTEGVRMVATQFEELLARWSVEPIVVVGQPFDPTFHEALQQVPSAEHPRMTVVEEVERGYRLGDRVVRPSKVIVSAGPPSE